MTADPGSPAPEPTPFEAVVAWLPHLTDEERGRLRAILTAPLMVRRRDLTPKPKQPTESGS